MSLFLDERVIAHAESTPQAPAVGVPGHWVTYAQLAAAIEHLTANLQLRRVGPGNFVLNALPVGIASVTAGLAVQRTGACLVEASSDWGATALLNVVSKTGARHAFIDARGAALFGSIGVAWDALWIRSADPLSVTTGVAHVEAADIVSVSPDGRPCAPAHDAVVVPRTPDDLAMVLFTSASTGDARGVMLTHRNVAANTASIVSYLALTSADRVMSILPLSYCYGRSLLQTHLWTGGSICFDDRFMYPRRVLEAIAAEGCTGLAGVPLTFELLRRRCDPRTISMPTLRYVTQAGGAMATELRRWTRDAFAPAAFYVMYGQTEATARLTYLPPERFPDKPDSIGIPIPGVEVRVVDDEGRDVEPGATGELIARGENVCGGYLGAPDATREVLRGDWLWTGDLARRDEEGFLFIVGRKKAMLKVGGHRFSPTEVEERLQQHPAIKEACVVGTPDAITGEAVWAFVVTEPDAVIDATALRRFCAEVLPPFKVPRAVVALNELPRSTAGKIRRAQLEHHARHAAIAARADHP